MRERIKELIKEIRGIKLAKDYLEEITEERAEQAERYDFVKAELSRLSARIKKLSNPSLLSVVREIQKRKQDKLDLYKQHHLNLALEYNELSKSLQKFDFEIDVLERKISQEASLIAEFKRLVRNEQAAMSAPRIREYKTFLDQLDYKLSLLKELEEAVDQGVRLNRRFNAAMKFIETKASSLYRTSKTEHEINEFNIKGIDKYQEYMINIQHSMMKFEAEVNDVYDTMLSSPHEDRKIAEHFLAEYRMNLINDIHTRMDMNNSYMFLKYHKSVFQGFTRTLRKDMKTLRKEVEQLESTEVSILDSTIHSR